MLTTNKPPRRLVSLRILRFKSCTGNAVQSACLDLEGLGTNRVWAGRAKDVGNWLSTGVSAPDRVLDRDTWESQSDADRQSSRWHTG